MDQCYKWQYLCKVLGKCFIGNIYRNIVQYCTWYNHSIRIRHNTYRHTMAHVFWVRAAFPEVQSLVEAGRTHVQIAWPLKCAVRVFKCLAQAHSNDNTGRCRESHPSIRNRRFALHHWSRVHICISKAITVKLLVWENTTCKELHPLELISKVTAEFAYNRTSRGLQKKTLLANWRWRYKRIEMHVKGAIWTE